MFTTINWTPTHLDKEYWYQSTYRILSGSDLSSWTNLSTTGPGINLNYGGTPPTINLADLNGKDSFSFLATSVATLTSPSNVVTVSPGSAYSLSFVHKGPTLGVNEYYSLVDLVSTSMANSATLYYTNIATFPTFYLQVGNTACTIIGCNFTQTNWHYIILNYNGGGDVTNVANYTLYINGVVQTLTSQANGGGAATLNKMGNAAGGPATNGGRWIELFLSNTPLTGDNLKGAKSYFQGMYKL